jgi:hemoglobin
MRHEGTTEKVRRHCGAGLLGTRFFWPNFAAPMKKQELNSREAITMLVTSFYTRVKQDDLLAPIFNDAHHFSWDTHIPIMINFWETLLLDTASYKGNTMQKHLTLHKQHPLTANLFDRWKLLFYSTLDELFKGPNVAEAKRRVEEMSGLMQFKIQQSEQKGFIQ